MLTKDNVQDWLNVLKVGFDPTSPFYGKIGFSGLLSLTKIEQHQVRDAMSPELCAMVFGPKKEN